jgi:D-glycero-D-manno-heptose 1,7-bisphosphate phosphatase
MTNKLIILDRDGVINEDSDAFVKSVDECHLIAGSVDAIARLSNAGFTVIVATNQSGLARGLFDEFALARIHQYIVEQVEQAGGKIAAFFYCPHGPDDHCQCRKPLPGLLTQAERELSLSVAGSHFVGDSLRDLQAGLAADCQPVLVTTGKGGRTLSAGLPEPLKHTPVYVNLSDFVDHLLDSREAL